MIETLGSQTLAVLLALGIVLGPAATALYFLLRRKKLALRERRSPLSADLLRPPGHTLRQRLDEGRADLLADLMLLVLMPALLLGFMYVASLVTGRAHGILLHGAAALGVLGFSAFQTRKLLRLAKQLEQWTLGLDAEMAAGQELDQLMQQGATVFHDLAADKFNIDHVVVSRQGVFAVETKGYRKPIRDGGLEDAKVSYDGKVLVFPDWADLRPLAQAERQARWLSDWLSQATGERVDALPVLALPGWYVDRKGRGWAGSRAEWRRTARPFAKGARCPPTDSRASEAHCPSGGATLPRREAHLSGAGLGQISPKSLLADAMLLE